MALRPGDVGKGVTLAGPVLLNLTRGTTVWCMLLQAIAAVPPLLSRHAHYVGAIMLHLLAASP